MTLFRKLSVFLICTAGLCASAAANGDRVYFSNAGEPRLPGCDDASVKSAVAGTFAAAMPGYTNGRTISTMSGVRQVSYRVNGTSPLARRYCKATARLSDGSRRAVFYMVEEHAGFVGLGWNVEACIASLDKWHVYGRYCSTVQPR